MKAEIEWHKVEYCDDGWYSDTIPDIGPVLVTTNWGEVSKDTVIDSDDGIYFEFFDDSVKAWAYLPEPYSYEGERENGR